VRLLLAFDDRPALLTLARAKSPDSDAELFDFSAVLRPVAGALRGDSAVVMPLRLAKEIGVRA
jgi:hypothetical protein